MINTFRQMNGVKLNGTSNRNMIEINICLIITEELTRLLCATRNIVRNMFHFITVVKLTA